MPERKPSFSSISASGSNFNPQNTLSIPAVKIFAVLDLDEKSWFSFGHYLGRQYRLKVEKGKRGPAKLLGRFLWVWVEDKTDTRSVERAVAAWYRKRAHETLGRYVEKCYRIVSRHGVPEPDVAIRFMRRRWGSCSPSGRITLNVNLVKVPVHCIEYVIIHELCHLKNHNHSKSFYSLLTRCLPDWRLRKKSLDRFRLY